MAHIKDISVSNNTYLIEPIVYAEANYDGNNGDLENNLIKKYTAQIDVNFEPVNGILVTLKMPATYYNAANATLKLGTNNYLNIYYNNSQITAGVLQPNKIYSFIYNNNRWELVGEKGILSINNQSPSSDGNFELTAATIGLDTPLNLVGTLSTTPNSIGITTDNYTEDIPTITGVVSYTPQLGDIILDSEKKVEYICIEIAENTEEDPPVPVYKWK